MTPLENGEEGGAGEGYRGAETTVIVYGLDPGRDYEISLDVVGVGNGGEEGGERAVVEIETGGECEFLLSLISVLFDEERESRKLTPVAIQLRRVEVRIQTLLQQVTTLPISTLPTTLVLLPLLPTTTSPLHQKDHHHLTLPHSLLHHQQNPNSELFSKRSEQVQNVQKQY